MPRVVPSQVVTLIDELFPQFIPQSQGRSDWLNLPIVSCYKLQGVLDLIDRIQPELIALDSRDFSAFVSSAAAIRIVMANPKSGGHGAVLYVELAPISEFGNINPLGILRDLLSKCPDEFPGTDTSELQFITDRDLRDSLRNDLGAVNRALANSEWKAATVVGGSVIEALLLWALQGQPQAAVYQAASKLFSASILKKKLDVNVMDTWSLSEFIEVSSELSLIDQNTATQVRLAKDFRNLIHPGRSIRLGQLCNRGTALAVVAGIELTIEDLS
jgi:hypothetical protein